MSSYNTLYNIINAYKINDIDVIKHQIKTTFSADNLVDITCQKKCINLLIKYTGMIVADMLIDNIDETQKQFFTNYCIAMLFKHNKYESAMLMTFKYKYNINMVFYYMQESNTDIDILKSIFTKYNEEMDTENGRAWLMNGIGKFNNIELLSKVKQYYEIKDIDVYNMLLGTSDKNNIDMCLNTIKYIFNNYQFDYDDNFMFNFMTQLHFIEHFDAIYYVISYLVETYGINCVDVLISNSNMDINFRTSLINYIITVFKSHLIPNTLNALCAIQN